jgi:hypothetical protein
MKPSSLGNESTNIPKKPPQAHVQATGSTDESLQGKPAAKVVSIDPRQIQLVRSGPEKLERRADGEVEVPAGQGAHL